MLDIDFSDGFFMLPLRLVQLVCALIGMVPLPPYPAAAERSINEFQCWVALLPDACSFLIFDRLLGLRQFC